MNSKIKQLCYFSIIILILYSCACINKSKPTKSQKNDHLEGLVDQERNDTLNPNQEELQPTVQPVSFNQGWKDTLEASKAEMKKIWLDRWHPKTDFEHTSLKAYKVYEKNVNLDELEMVPVEEYVIKWNAFMNWTPNESVETILTLDKNRVRYYAVKDEAFYYLVLLQRKYSKWECLTYGPIFTHISDSLSILYFNKKVDFINVNVETSAEEKPYERFYTVYKENGILKVLDYNKPLDIVLSDFKEVLKSGQMW